MIFWRTSVAREQVTFCQNCHITPPVEKSLSLSLYILAYCRLSCYSLLVYLPMPFAILVAFLEVLVLKRIVNKSLVTCVVSTLGWTLGTNQDLCYNQAILLGTAACLVLALTLVLLELYTCDSSGGMSPVHVLLTCTRLPLSKQDMLASVSEAIKARPCIL
jgi:hypothetical protein